MIHTSRTVTVGKTESIINEPIVLYRGDREVEVEFAIVGSKFTFTNGGNVIQSTNATHGQLVVDTPTGENMFSEVTECHEGKVVFIITKEMIDELAEVGLYSFQIRLFDESQVSRVTIPPVYQGIEIRHPMAAEDETDLVDIGLVDYSVVRKNDYENVATFLPNGDYNKTNWEEHDVISRDRLNKVEDALYEINKSTEGLYPTFQNQYDEFSAKVDKDVKAYKEEMEDEVEQFERDMTQAFGEFKVDYKDEVHERLDIVEGELEEVSTQLAHIENVKTVQDLKNMDLKLNTIIQTCGYYEINDGGANTYIVIPNKEYSYDIECEKYAIRPIAISNTVCPKQFGTINDGINGDNEWLQACFDFVRDYNISVIDGRNLLYTTDSSTATKHGHKGVLIHQPVTLRNYKGQPKDDISDLTSIIDILQVENDFREYVIENCEFNGKYGIVPRNTIGAEDGGKHCICFYAESSRFPKEFIPMGNITIRNCRIIKPDAYGIFISAADCIYTVEDCTFDTNGPCILSYATTMIAKNCTATINSSYKTMVLNFLHDEMEMGRDYQGTKLKSFYVDNCHVTGGSVIKTHNNPQGAMSYDNIYINNSSSTVQLFEMYQQYQDKETTINEININNSSGKITLTGFRIKSFILDDEFGDVNDVTLQANVDVVKISNYEFGKGKFISVEDINDINFVSHVNNFYLIDCKALSVHDDYFDALGTPTGAKDKITNLYIDNFIVGTNYRIIETGIENVYINNLHVLPDITSGFDFLYNRHTQGCKKCIIKNSVFESPTNKYGYILQNQYDSTGGTLIIMNCVYTQRLGTALQNMVRKDINLVRLDSTE